jgi:hypothetical protein
MNWTERARADIQREANSAHAWLCNGKAWGSTGEQRARDFAYLARCQNALRYLNRRSGR